MSTSGKNAVIYVNYSPYENSGKILDYLLDNFKNVYLFSIGFYNLENKKNYNNLSIYRNGKLEKTYSLFQIPISSNLVYLLIPIRSIVTFIEIFVYSYWLSKKYKRIDVYFTVNAFTAWVGMLLKKIGIVKKTVFWVWDYYPPIHESKSVMLMRYVYWQFDKISSHSDVVAFVNKRLLNLRKDMGIYKNNVKYPIVPIGADKINLPKSKPTKNRKPVFGFIGVLKKTQGVDIVFDNASRLTREFGNVKYEIVGSGPDEKYFKARARKSKINTKFYGYLDGDSFNDVLKECAIGIATYTSDAGNVSQYGDPGKIKRYLSLGIPIITTDVIEFAEEIERSGAGIVVDYHDGEAFIEAVKKIMNKHALYRKNAYKLSQKFYYRKIYPKMFDTI